MNAARMIAIAIVVLAVTPTSRADDPPDAYQAPSEPPVLAAWKIGQWATYRVKAGAGESTVTARIVAEDGCGVWIDVDYEQGTDRRSVRTCVARGALGRFTTQPNRMGIVRRDNALTDINDEADALRGKLLDKLLRAEWHGRRGLPREELTTPAGTTLLAVKETPVDGNSARTRWSHPAVPLGGLVRDVDGDEELLLLEHGVRDSSVILDDNHRLLAHTKTLHTFDRPRKKWLAFSFGSDLLGTLDDASSTESLGFTIGYKLTPSVALALDTTRTGLAPYPPIPELAEALAQATLGVRWYPHAGSRSRWAFLTRTFYAQLDAGYAHIERRRTLMSSSVVGRGGVAGVRVGFSSSIARDWTLAIELREHTALLNADEGTRIALGIHGVVELYLP